jgi:hypothetical protein
MLDGLDASNTKLDARSSCVTGLKGIERDGRLT